MKTMKYSGFTILELIIVMAIMIMIMSLATPSLRRLHEKASFKSGVQALQSELHKTRLLAMKTGIPYVFHYCRGTGEYEIIPKEVYQYRYQQMNQTSAVTGSLQTPGQDSSADNTSVFNDKAFTDNMSGDNISGSLTTADSPSLLSDSENHSENQLNTETDPANNTSDMNLPGTATADTSALASQTQVAISTGMAESKHTILPEGTIFMNGLVSDMTPANLQKKKTAESEEQIEVDLGSSLAGSLHPEEDNQNAVSQWSEPILFYPNGRTSQAVIILCNSADNPYYAEIALRGLTGIARISAIATIPPTDLAFPTVLTPEQIEMLQQKDMPVNSSQDDLSPFSNEDIPIDSLIQ